MVQSNLNKKLFLINEIDNRRFYEGNTQHHTIQHNHLHFRVNSNFDVAWGQTFSWQNPQFPDAAVKLTVPEIAHVPETLKFVAEVLDILVYADIIIYYAILNAVIFPFCIKTLLFTLFAVLCITKKDKELS